MPNSGLESAVNKIVRGLIALSILVCGSGMKVSAQVPGSCWHYITGITLPFNGAYDCIYAGLGGGGVPTYNCKLWDPGPNCLPAAAPGETCPTCGGAGGSSPGSSPGSSRPSAGSPISLVTGNTFIDETDLRIPGLSGGLSLTRRWNSLWPSSQTSLQTGLFGPNWRSTYEERIFMGSDNYVKYSRSDGSFWSFAGGGTLTLVAPANVAATLATDSNFTEWILSFQNGEQRIFSFSSGSLTAIIDRNGNATQLTYDNLNRLTTVTDPGGRHLYFGYQNNSSYLVTSVTSDVGISLSYSYNSQGRLTQVTEPDQTTLNFSYDSNSNITSVIDSAGKVIESHTYDSLGRGLTSSRANGVEAVTVSY